MLISYLLRSAVLLILLFMPYVLGDYHIVLFTEILIWAIFAMAWDLMYGYTGMLSFVQGTLFGIGSYALTLSINHWHVGIFTALTLGVLVATLSAIIIGFMAVRITGTHFTILTIIISLVLFYVGMSWRWVTGGDDGISLTEIPEFGFEKYSLSLYDPIVNYFFVLFFFCSSFLILHRITVSPLGKIFVSIRENEGRTRLIGYNVERFKLIAFITSATFCGLAGALYSLTLRFSNVRMTHWTVSSDGMIWTIIGGVGSLYGAVLGTTLLIFSTDYISSWFENHRIITGAILVFFVVAAPKGIIGIIRGLLERRGYLGKK